MKIEIIGAFGGQSAHCRLTCLLINDRVALDIGSLTQVLPIERQVKVESIVLTHSHMDHIASLPFFIENVFGQSDGAVDLYASPATVYAIRKHLFNNDTWPDFTRIPNHLLPAIIFHELSDEVPFTLDGVTFTPIPVDHLVPTYGFLLEQGDSQVIWSSDTGPTQRLWEVANRCKNLKAVCLDVSFDNQLQHIADLSYHLTPAGVARELEKLRKDVPVYLHHLKPVCIEKIEEEVKALNNPRLHFLEQGRVYEF